MRGLMMALCLLGQSTMSQATVLQATSASYLFTTETSVETGCRRATERLKIEVIESQCGTQLSGGKVRVQGGEQDLLDRLYFESTAGYVTQYNELHRTVEMVEPLPDESMFRCAIEAELEVVCTQGRRDPKFAPLFEQQVSLNQLYFLPGEEVVITIQPKQEMFVTILQWLPYLDATERVWRLFPNPFQSRNHLSGDAALLIPDPQQDGYRFEVALPQGEDRVVEELVVLATREAVNFPEQMSVEQFHRILAEIPLSQRRELFIPYEIIESERLFRRSGEVQ